VQLLRWAKTGMDSHGFPDGQTSEHWLDSRATAFADVLSAQRDSSIEQAFIAAAGGSAGVTSLVCGTVLCMRRLSGAMMPASEPVGLLAACSLGVAAVGVGMILVSDGAAARAGHGIGWGIAARIGLLLGVVAIAVPPAAASGIDMAACAAAVLGSAAMILRPLVPHILAARVRWPIHRQRQRREVCLPASGQHAAIDPAMPAAHAQVGLQAPCPGHLLQRFERYQLPEADCLRGTIHLAVPVGVRTAYGHVGFCPPFAEMPTVEVTTDYDHVEAIVSAAEVLPWGVRVECRLDEPAEEAFEIPINLSVQSPVQPTVATDAAASLATVLDRSQPQP